MIIARSILTTNCIPSKFFFVPDAPAAHRSVTQQEVPFFPRPPPSLCSMQITRAPNNETQGGWILRTAESKRVLWLLY